MCSKISMCRKQVTLALLKPDIVVHPIRLKMIMKCLEKDGFQILASRQVKLSVQQAELFYNEHKGRFFFKRLTEYLSSGPIQALVLERRDAIRRWRTLLGPTKAYRARLQARNTLRAKYGLSDTRNVGHGSDSEVSAQREINFFFPTYDELDSDVRRK